MVTQYAFKDEKGMGHDRLSCLRVREDKHLWEKTRPTASMTSQVAQQPWVFSTSFLRLTSQWVKDTSETHLRSYAVSRATAKRVWMGVPESQSIHNFSAISQLSVKITRLSVNLQIQDLSYQLKKKEEKKIFLNVF